MRANQIQIKYIVYDILESRLPRYEEIRLNNKRTEKSERSIVIEQEDIY